MSLLTQYSATEIFVVLILFLVALRFLEELISHFYEKLKKQILKEEETPDKIQQLEEKIDRMITKMDQNTKQIEQTENALKIVQERLQENTRTAIIDAHHKYVYNYSAIDDITMQSLERRYLYYKASGGNSFIDTLMEEMRALPRLSLENKKILETINDGAGNI